MSVANVVRTQEEAAKVLSLSIEDFKRMRELEGFPGRPGAYDVDSIQDWLRGETQSLDAPGEDDTDAAVKENQRILDELDAELRRREQRERVELSLPLSDPEANSYIAQFRGRLEVRLDRETELQGFLQLHAGLRAGNATLADGKPVSSAADVVRYLAWQITRQLAEATENAQ